jgi:protein phosphatase
VSSTPVDGLSTVEVDAVSEPFRRPWFELSHAVRTHTGLVRDHNEDDALVMDTHGLYLVADGMGGHAAGSVASELCVAAAERSFRVPDVRDDEENGPYADLTDPAWQLAHALRLANEEIYRSAATNRELHGMGTTAVATYFYEDMIAVSHAGDSRVYLLRDHRFTQVTSDHSLSNFLLALGRDLEAQMAEATMSNVIMRALGLEPDVLIDTQEFRARTGDRLMLCSDGLSDLVDDHTIASVLSREDGDLDTMADDLVALALDAGGRDNITVLIVEVGQRSASAPPETNSAHTVQLDAVSDSADDTDDPALDDTTIDRTDGE